MTIYKKHGKTYEQFELDLEEQGPEQLSLFEPQELAANDSELETLIVNTKGDK